MHHPPADFVVANLIYGNEFFFGQKYYATVEVNNNDITV
jgi:hypothetical protein